MDDGETARESASLMSRSALVGFCLVAALSYRASVSLIPTGILEDAFVLGLSAVFLGLSVVIRRGQELRRYWEVPYAFFVFTAAALLGDGTISPLQHAFVTDVLHETTSTNNPLASSVFGSVLAQLFGTLLLVAPIVLLTMASGSDLRSIFIDRVRKWWPLIVGLVGFLVVFFLVARGRTEAFFPTNGGAAASRFLALAPALVVLVLMNGLREELWFRGLFLRKYGNFLSPWSSNILAAVIFTSFHVQVQYSASILPFLAIALVNGLFLGWLMQKSGSLWASVLFHAATDLPIFLVYLSYAK
jgi:membrane protease YdiL (CAAX protease family)